MPIKKSKISFAHNNLYFLDNRCKDTNMMVAAILIC